MAEYDTEVGMGNYIINLWWGGDPDKPNPISGMTLRDIYNVQRTWAPVYQQAGTYGMEMFLRLFRKDPNTKTFFKAIVKVDEVKIANSFQFRAHVNNLMASINTTVVNLKEPEVVAALMHKLGETHRGRRIEKSHFDIFKEIWIDVLQNDLKVNERVMVSWDKYIAFIYKYIYEKLGDS